MSIVAPAPSASRGEIILQPTYFTSSIFVKAARDDITTLILAYHEQYTNSQPTQPFALFKALWCSQGWNWMHFMVFDSRTRHVFLNTILRLFLERMAKTQAPYSRAVALFGFYTLFYTQPLGTAPPLHNIAHIPIQLDHYTSLKALPSSLNAAHLLPLQPFVSHIISLLLKDNVFFIVPHSELGPLNPLDLPREIFIDSSTGPLVDSNAPKKKGRPTKRDKIKRTRLALNGLDQWLEKTAHSSIPTSSSTISSMSDPASAFPSIYDTLGQYQQEKSHLLQSLSQPTSSGTLHAKTIVEQANQLILDRLKAADRLALKGPARSEEEIEIASIARIERAISELDKDEGWMGGALGLLEGAGRIQQL